MNTSHDFFRANSALLRHPLQILRMVSLGITTLVLLGALILPTPMTFRVQFIMAALVGLAYETIIWTPFLPNKQSLTDTFPKALLIFHFILLSGFAALFLNVTVSVAVVYLIPIVGTGMRRGWQMALWSAFLAVLGFLITLEWLGIRAAHINDWIVFSLFFFVIALFTGLLVTALHQRTREYENIVHHSHEAIFLVNKQGQFLYLNPAAVELGNYNLHELAGHTLWEFVLPEDTDKARHVWDEILAGRVTDEVFPVHVQPRNSAPRTLAVTMSLLDNQPQSITLIARDITLQEKERQDHERRDLELEAERVVTQATSQTTDLPGVLHVALAQVLKTLRYDAGAIYLADDAQQTLTLAISQNLSDDFIAGVRQHHFGEGFTGQAAASREIIFGHNPSYLRNAPPMADGRLLHTQISMPLIYHERVVGVLNVNSASEQAPAKQDTALLGTIAASLAVAIDRARLFETLEQRVAQRTEELATLNRIAAVANQSLDLGTILGATLDELIHSLGIQGGWISQVDQGNGALHMIAQRGIPTNILDHPTIMRLGEGVGGQVALENKPRSGNLADLTPSTQVRLNAASIQAFCAVPLAMQGRAIGVLNLISRTPDRFGEAEMRWLGAVGNTIAVAMENAQLFQAEHRAREKAQTLRQAAYTISRSLQLEQILRLLLEQLKHVLTYDTASVFVLQEDEQPLLISGMGYKDEQITSHAASDLLKSSPILAQLARTLEPITVADVRESADWIWVPGAEHVRAFLAVPIVSQGKLIGALMADSVQPDFFKADDAQYAQSLAQHIAVALTNAQLYESVKRKADQLATLREIDHTLNSMLELAPMLEEMLNAIAQIVPYDRANVFLLEGGRMRALAQRRINQATSQRYALEISASPYLAEMLRDRKAIILGDVRAAPTWIRVTGMEDVRSWLGVPLIAREQMIGQISLYGLTLNAFNSEQGELVLAFANHAAIAIANAQLRTELREQARLDSLTQVLNHGALIQELGTASEQARQRNEPLAMIMLDLDDFKHYNDTYGHIVGDLVLDATVKAIRQHIKHDDLVGRWGGEEFGIALIRADKARALLVAERIRRTLRQTTLHDRNGAAIPPPTASQGIAVLNETIQITDELIDRADRALYRAKNCGKDQITVAE